MYFITTTIHDLMEELTQRIKKVDVGVKVGQIY